MRALSCVCSLCVVLLVDLGPSPTGAAWSAPALKDPKGHTKESRAALRKRIAALQDRLRGEFERVKIGKDSLGEFLAPVRELYEAEVALADTREEERAVLENALRVLWVCEEQFTQLHQAGLHPAESVHQSQAARARVQLELEKRAPR
jgi:outer membrane protein TolC